MKRLNLLILCLLSVLILLGACSPQNLGQDASIPPTSANTVQTPACLSSTAASTKAPTETPTAAPTEAPTSTDVVKPQWRYIDDPYSLNRISDNSWTLPEFDDSTWLTGSGSFGAYKGRLDEIEGTVKPNICLRHYLPDGTAVPTYYFRMSFTADQLKADYYKTTVSYDDAVIIYLNGQPVFYGNVPSEGYKQKNAYGSEETFEALPEDIFYLDTSKLNSGENVLAVELHQAYKSSSDVFFHMGDLTPCDAEIIQTRNSSICLGVGATESEMLVSWQGMGTQGRVELTDAKSGKGSSTSPTIVMASQAYGMEGGVSTFRAVLTDLKPDTSYSYRVIDAGSSNTFTFTTPQDGEFTFFVNGDPQICKADDEEPIEIYDSLLDQAAGSKQAAFILSLGDQSDKADNSKLFLRYLSSEWVKKTPVAAIVGNHEAKSDQFSHFFNMPNMDAKTVGESGDMSGDYWFFRNNTLFLCINSNNTDIEAHKTALEAAKKACISQFGTPKWIVAAFHHSIFSVGDHAESKDIINRRNELTPIFKSLSVDVVFMGHDHSYVRTYPMNGTTPQTDKSWTLTNPEGIIYFTLTSSTGTKFYDISDTKPKYAAVVSGEKTPCITRVDVTDTTFTITTFRQGESSLEVLDDLKIVKGSNEIATDPLSTGKFGMFSWEDNVTQQSESSSLASVIEQSGVSEVYQVFTKDSLSKGEPEEFIRTMAQQKVQTYALIGKPEWAREADGSSMIEEIKNIVNYNKSHSKVAIHGIVVDVEPHVLSEWSKGEKTREELCQSFVSGLKAAYSYAKKNDLKMTVCVTCSLDDVSKKSLEEIVSKCCDRIAVMNYDRSDEFGQISAEVNLAKQYAKPIICIYELQKVGTHNLKDINTYANKGLNALWQSADRLQGQFAYDRLSFAYHYYMPLKDMLAK